MEIKECLGCHKEFPPEVIKPSRDYRCPPCAKRLRELDRPEKEAKKRMAEKQADVQKAKKIANQLLNQNGQKKIDVAHVSELAEEMLKKYGGLEQFMAEWKMQLDEAIAKNPGSKTVLDGFKAFGNMIVVSTQHRESAPDVESLTEDDILRELHELLRHGEAMQPDVIPFEDVG